MKIPASIGPELLEVCRRSIRGFLEHDMPTYSAALAYRALFALFPFFAFLVALLGLLDIGGFFEWLINQTHSALQAQYANRTEQLLRQGLYQAQGAGLISSVIIIAVWSVSGGVRSLTKALNTIHGVGESRPAWKRVVLQAFFALGLAVTIILATALLLIGPRLVEWIVGLVGLDEVFVSLWSWLRLPVALVLIMLAVSVLYWVVPNVDHPYRLITPGAALAVIVWVIASLGFAYYVSNFANYSVVYGSLGAAIALLLYFYISAAVLLLGAEVNVAIHHRVSGRNIQQKEARGTGHETPSAEDSGTKAV
ncbi:MAG: rane protein [Rubrobacteraceae bacterium]|nr:rane protein [Rubrobacteraceae bacterium]